MSNKITPDPLADISAKTLNTCPKVFDRLPYSEGAFEQAAFIAERITQHAQLGFGQARCDYICDEVRETLEGKGVRAYPVFIYEDAFNPHQIDYSWLILGGLKGFGSLAEQALRERELLAEKRDYVHSFTEHQVIWNGESPVLGEREYLVEDERDSAALNRAEELKQAHLDRLQAVRTQIKEEEEKRKVEDTWKPANRGCLPLLILAAMIPVGVVTTCIWNIL